MNKKVTIGQIITVIVSLIIGMLTVFIIQNYIVSEKIVFNTLGLLGFVLSILFGGASIVLAFAAINLGKSSEQMMIERSEKSIELQNEVYIKTTEALRKIESSTGVTEKRIEDIIAGRVGDIASRLVDNKIVTGKDRDRLEHELRRSLSKELTEEEKKELEEKRKRKAEVDELYDKFKDETLLLFANSDGTKTLRVADGSFTKRGVELLDGLFEINGIRTGICTFYSDPVYVGIFDSGVDEFLNNLAEEIAKSTFDKVILAFNELSEITDKFNKEIEKIKNLYKPEIAEKIVLLVGNPEEIIEAVR